METQARGVESEVESHAGGDVGRDGRRYRSPPRVLVRSFRMGRDNWKIKHQAVQEKLEQERQLSADRGRSREQWKQKCETATSRAEQAELLAQQRLKQLEQARAELANLMAKKGDQQGDVRPVGGSTPVAVIDKVRRLVMMAGSSLRSLPRIFEIFQSDPDPDVHLPSASGARWWLLRMGLYALREPLEQASDWVFGKLKTLEGDQCSSGFTRYVLSLGAVVGDWTTTRIKDALDKTRVKLVKAWCKEHLPVSVQAQRRLAFSPQIP